MMKLFYHKVLLTSGMAIVISLVSSNTFAKKNTKPLLTGASTTMLANTCAGCHGDKGASHGPSIPTLAGMSASYMVDIMEEYKNGGIPSTIMGRLAKGYSDKEIKQMADFFAEQEFVGVAQKSDAKLAKKGAKIHKKYCEKCHSEGGTVADDDSGFLKGQWKSYLAAQMMDYKSKDREASKKMAKKMKKMHKKYGDDGTKALLEFYSAN